jgi:outer membrane protein assembly factor BamA
MRLSRFLALLLLIAPLTALAQTYTPQEIRMEGAEGTNTADLLRVANLKPGAAVTVAEIEAAMQRLGDTGMFSDIRYSVDSKALVFKLKLAAAAASLPVRYANFVWWQPAELEKLVEARVPIFHGSLPLRGNLTEQVEAALVSLLQEKGIDATITALESHDTPHGPITSTALLITRPQIALGKIHLQGGLPALQSKFEERELSLSDEDFDVFTSSEGIRLNVADVYQNAGYLDATTEPAVYSAPRTDPSKSSPRFLVDATAVVHAGEVYRISRIDLPTAPPLSQSEVAHAADLKVGAPASALALRIARSEIQKLAGDRGYLAAKATVDTAKDSGAHTVAYTFGLTLGEIFRLSTLDASELPAAQRQAFLRSVHPAPGVVVDKELTRAIFQALQDLQLRPMPHINTVIDIVHHTAAIVIKP